MARIDLDIFVPMRLERAACEPPAVWLRVEQEINRGWHFKAKSTCAYYGIVYEPGWLNNRLPLVVFEHLLALDVPVTRMFTAFSVARRAVPSQGGGA